MSPRQRRTHPDQQRAAREAFEVVTFDQEGRLVYLDSHLGSDQDRVLLAVLLLASCDPDPYLEDALEQLEEHLPDDQ